MRVTIFFLCAFLAHSIGVCAQPRDVIAVNNSVLIDSGYVKIDNGRLFYEMYGSGEPIVLIHGNFGDLRYWDEQVVALSASHRVLLYDVRGFGKSSLPLDGVSYAHHEDLALLLKALDIPRAHIVGFSMGSGIAVNFVLVHPEMSLSLATVGPWVEGYFSDAARAMFQDFTEMRNVMEGDGPQAVADFALRQTFLGETIHKQRTEDQVHEIISDFSWWYFTRKNPVISMDATERIHEINIPNLIVTAEYDIPACREIATLLDETVPNSRKVDMADSGHFMMIDKPDEFNQALLDFFSGIH